MKQGDGPTLWEKIQQADSVQLDSDEIKTAIHWFRQTTSLVCGVIWGILPLTGLYGFLIHLAINSIGTIIFYTSILKIDPEEHGGHGAMSQEGLPPALSMFILVWIVTYSLVQF